MYTQSLTCMNTSTSRRRRLTGTVVSDKMDQTIVVKVDRFVKHPKYGKYYTISKRYKAHVAGEMPTLGTEVLIQESKPFSKTVHFELIA